ncbi:MAG: S-layer homology domain-containing protein [Clostridia bacterium]|nr:S-layer homology domain-containing protein [Clostridia bacterium]
MKKSIALITAAGLLLSSATVLAAGSIEETVAEFDITVKYTDDTAFSKATLQMFSEDYSKMLYMAECTPQEVDGVYVADFAKFSVDSELPTGKYILRVGNGKEITPKTIDFFNYDHQMRAFKAIRDAADDTALNTAIEAGKTLVDFGYDTYSSFSPEWQKKIRASVLALVWDENKTDDEHMQQFFNYMDRMYEAVGILSETDSTKVISKIETAEILTFDTKYYTDKLISDKSYIGGLVGAYDFTQYSDVEEAVAALYNQFDGAVLTYIIANNDWATAEEVLEYFDEKTLVDVDFESDYNDLSSNKKSNVLGFLKDEKITDYTKLAERFEYYADEEASKKSSGGGGGSSSGGSGSPSTVVAGDYTTPSTTQSTTNTAVFNDLGSVSWAEKAISALTEKGAISGDGNGSFNPHNAITREEFTKIIVAAFDMYNENATADFADVADSDWSAKYIASAYENGLVSGIGDGIFGKKNEITREDAAVILYRIYTKNNDAISGGNVFADSSSISAYAGDAICAMYELGVVNGYEDGSFGPKKSITRAEASVMIYNLLAVN